MPFKEILGLFETSTFVGPSSKPTMPSSRKRTKANPPSKTSTQSSSRKRAKLKPSSKTSTQSSSRKRTKTIPSCTRSPRRTKTQRLQFAVPNFKKLKQKRGQPPILSPILKAHGRKWQMGVYPRGDHESSDRETYISCHLYSREEGGVSANVTLGCKGFQRSFQSTAPRTDFGYPNFLEREVVLQKHLQPDGSLLLEAEIEVAADAVWYPKPLIKQDLLVALYQDSYNTKTWDAVFAVEGKKFRVHKTILSLRAQKLYELATQHSGPIPISTVRRDMFENLLDFVYTVKTPSINNKDTALELLLVAKKFGCTHLKLYMESLVVDRFLDEGNALELFIFGDSHSCALLKEAALWLCDMESATVRTGKAWAKLKKSKRLLVELLEKPTRWVQNPVELDRMDVTTLRTELDKANLDLDGSREDLVNRLKTHRSQGQQQEVVIVKDE